MIWLEAALTLPRHQRGDAYRDIAAMTGRSMMSIHRQVGRAICEQKAA